MSWEIVIGLVVLAGVLMIFKSTRGSSGSEFSLDELLEAKQAILNVSSMEPDAARRKKGRSKTDRVVKQSLN